MAASAALALWSGSAGAQGLYLPGQGSVNLPMLGNSTAAPVDAEGANYWNPAAIAAYAPSEVGVSLTFGIPDSHLKSTVEQGAIVPGAIQVPGVVYPESTLSGSTRSDSGVLLAPSLGLVYHVADSPWTFGLGFVAFAASNNFPGSTTNPVLSVLGPQYINMTVMQLSLNAAYRLNEQLAFGFGPMVDATIVSINPAMFAEPTSVHLAPPPRITYPAASNGSPAWGGGFQVGLVYDPTPEIATAISFKSPQWLERWTWNTTDAQGNPEEISLQAGLPLIVSTGVAYKGLERTVIEVDGRWFNWSNTPLFGSSAEFDLQTLTADGLGWRDVFSVGLGVQHQLYDWLALRGGYMWSVDPVPNSKTLFNAQLGGLITMQNFIGVGAGLRLTDDAEVSLGYMHGFADSDASQIAGIPGTDVEIEGAINAIQVGVRIAFGGPDRT